MGSRYFPSVDRGAGQFRLSSETCDTKGEEVITFSEKVEHLK